MFVTSPDGTSIHVEVHGSGRALVLVSGALFASERWKGTLEGLVGSRSVRVMERRGRGKSGNASAYAPEREVEDVLAVLAAQPQPFDLFGHSSGAILALQAALTAPSGLRRLVLYEPPLFFAEPDRIASDLAERLDSLLASGHAADAVTTFLREGPRESEADITALRENPHFGRLVAEFAHTVPYDARVQRSFPFDRARLARLETPTLLLVGGRSPERMLAGSRALLEVLPNAELRRLEGQKHMAMLSVPKLFAEAVNAGLPEP